MNKKNIIDIILGMIVIAVLFAVVTYVVQKNIYYLAPVVEQNFFLVLYFNFKGRSLLKKLRSENYFPTPAVAFAEVIV